MKQKKITAIVEASSTGFGIYTDDLFGVTSYAGTIEEARENFKEAIADAGYDSGMYKINYAYDFASLFKYFPLDTSAFAARIKMNPSLLRQYKNGLANASDKQIKKIESGLHELGRELLAVKL